MTMALRAVFASMILGIGASGRSAAEGLGEEAEVSAIFTLASFFDRYDPRAYSSQHTPSPAKAIAELAISSSHERVRKVGLNVLREPCPDIAKGVVSPLCVKKTENDPSWRQQDIGSAGDRIALGAKDPEQAKEAVETLLATVTHTRTAGKSDRRAYDAIQNFPWLYFRMYKDDPQDASFLRARMGHILQQASLDPDLKFRAEEATARIRCAFEKDPSSCAAEWRRKTP